MFRNTNSSAFYIILHQEADKVVLESILSIVPTTSLKRQFPNDLEDTCDLTDTPEKIPFCHGVYDFKVIEYYLIFNIFLKNFI